MSARSSAETFGRPTALRDRQRQYAETHRGASARSSPVEQARLPQAQRGTIDKAERTEIDRYCSGAGASAFVGKHIDLLPEDQDFRLEICPRFEKQGKQPENQLEQVDHQAARLLRPLPASMLNRILGTHSGIFIFADMTFAFTIGTFAGERSLTLSLGHEWTGVL